MGVTFSQMFPPAPPLTEHNLSSQSGRTFLITGGTSGIGFELAKFLYQAGGNVYITSRSESSAKSAISQIESAPKLRSFSPGRLSFLVLQLDDLSTIRAAADSFLSRENQLHVLFNNAGISLMTAPTSLTKQNHELHIATNCLGPYLLTTLLLPALKAAAVDSPSNTVRVVWTGSIVVDSVHPGGIDISRDLPPAAPPTLSKALNANYTLSKTGNWFLASELARRHGRINETTNDDNTDTDTDTRKGSSATTLLSLAVNPGNLQTGLLRYAQSWIGWVVWPLLYDAKYGAYTNLWAGVGDEISALASFPSTYVSGGSSKRYNTPFFNGSYILPWGRIHPYPRADLLEALEPESVEGATSSGAKAKAKGYRGQAAAFWDWCERQVCEFR